MQRMWMRALIFVAVSAVSMLATSEAEAQGPVRRLFRRMFGRDEVVTTRSYVNPSGNRVMTRDGFTYSTPGRVYSAGAAETSGRWNAPLDRTARGGSRLETRFDGQAAPASRIDAGANVRAPDGTNVRAGADARDSADLRGEANVRGDADARLDADARRGADINRSDGAIRGEADAELRGNVTPPDAPATPDTSDDTLPPSVPTP